MLTEITYLNHHLPIRLDWWRKLARCFGVADANSVALTEKLQSYCHAHAIDGEGIMTSELRQSLCETYASLKIQLIGTHLEPRCLFHTRSEAEVYDACEAIVREADGCVFDTAYVPQILAIRGAEVREDGVWQTDSAKRFVAEPYGVRDHFSSNKAEFIDSVFILFWRTPEKHAEIFRGTVNPGSIWADGTAHLLDGQYTFKLGKHRTYSRPHIEAVEQFSAHWPVEWIYEHDHEHIRYIALEGVSPVNVVRSSGESLDLCEEDIARADLSISRFKPTYVNTERIKINIHTCPSNASSSLGCQNVVPEDYARLIEVLLGLELIGKTRNDIAFETWYQLIDASKIG